MDETKDFEERFKKMTNKEFLATVRDEKKKPGWVTSRGLFLTALRNELEKRKINK